MKKIIIAFCLSLIIGFVIYDNSSINNELSNKPKSYLNNLPVYSIDGIYAYDISTPDKAIATSDYVFVARIDKIVDTEYRNYTSVEIATDKFIQVADPYTIYTITIVKNLKGKLPTTKSIEIEQFGGLNLDKESYSFLDDSTILTIGNYYLLLGVAPFDGSRIQINIPKKIIDLKIINNLQLKQSLDQDKILEYIDNDETIVKYTNISLSNPILNNSIWGNFTSHISIDDINYKK